MAPIPGPGKKEKQDAFHSRCMSDEVMKKEFPDMKQRNAVCFSKWREHEKKNNQSKEEVVNMKVTVCDLIANKHTQFTDADKEWLSALKEEQLALLMPVNIPTDNEDDDAKKKAAEEARKKAEEMKNNEQKPVTYEELLAAAPPAVRAQHEFVANMVKAHREKLVTQIKANKTNKFTDDQLNAMSDELLQATADSFPAETQPVANYAGFSGTFTPQHNSESKEEPLSIPTLNVKEDDKK